MEIRVQRNDLAKELQLVQGIVERKSSIPILQNVLCEARSGELKGKMGSIRHPHLVVWGMRDGVIQEADMTEMATVMPDCRFVAVPGIGHCMNLEAPKLYAGYFGAWFGGF